MRPLDAVREELRKFKVPDDGQRGAGSRPDAEARRTYISFSLLDDSLYAVPIAEVKEVAPYIQPKNYPFDIPGHLGVVNLRGGVVPVIILGDRSRPLSKQTDGLKLLIFQGDESEVFAVLVSRVKKIQFDSAPETNVVNLEGVPLRFTSVAELNSIIRGMNATGAESKV